MRPAAVLRLPLAGLIVLAVLAPLLGLGIDGAAFASLAERAPALGRYGVNTLLLAASAAGLAALLGTACAWLIERCRFAGRDICAFALFLPFALPPYLAAFIWSDLADRIGIGFALRNPLGAALIMALALYPYVYFLVRPAFSQQTGALSAAARTLGCTPWQAFCKVSLPLARPAIAIGALLVAMETANDIAVAEDYGLATLGYFVYDSWLNRGERAAAAAAAILLALLALAASWSETVSRIRQRHHQSQLRTFASEKIAKLSGGKALAAAGVCWLPVLLGFAIPVLALIRHALLAPAVAWQRLPAGLLGTALLIAGAAALAYLLAAAFAFVRSRSRVPGLFEMLARSGYAIPGSVFALGCLGAAAAAASILKAITGVSLYWLWVVAPVVLIYALAVRYLAVAAGALEAGVAALSPGLDKTARSCGLSRWQRLRMVHLPLMAPALAAGLLLIATDIAKELPLTLILRPFGMTTLAVEAYGFAADEDLLGAAPPALALVALAAAGLIVVHRHFRAGNRISAG
ncbi:MAG: ABC transporter permease subunit [Betaproteobacteria bacterium]|nr:ABC transporter permease subunit [Betaproteobacteria bacterium]